MKESTTYQKILEEGRQEGRQEGREAGLQEGRTEGLQAGRAEEAQNMLLLVGERRFGKPTAVVVRRMRAIQNPAPLEAMAQRLFEVESWEELLA